MNHFLYCDTWLPKLFFPFSLLCFFKPHQFEVGARGTSVWAWASGGGPKNVLGIAELETKEAAMCEGPGQPSQLQKDDAKRSVKCSHLVFILFLFHKRRKIKLRGTSQHLGVWRVTCNFSEPISQLKGYAIYEINTKHKWNNDVWIIKLFIWLLSSIFPG